MTISRFLLRYTWIVILLVLGIFLFYWFQIRPIIVYRSCAAQSSADARTLLANKAALSKGTPQGNTYAQLLQKNLYLRTDYESFLLKCLTYHGFQIVPLSAKNISGVTLSGAMASTSHSK